MRIYSATTCRIDFAGSRFSILCAHSWRSYMRNSINVFLCLSLIIFSSLTFETRADDRPSGNVKDWTFLIYLNGNNNLDSFGTLNINQMEQVGSTENINIVVQWASLAKKKTQRLFVVQDKDKNKVTSPVVQDMGNVDMGDWR